jgi:hypothetical protein
MTTDGESPYDGRGDGDYCVDAWGLGPGLGPPRPPTPPPAEVEVEP